MFARGENDATAGGIEPLGRDAQVPPRLELIDVGLVGERQIRGRDGTEQVVLGQRRTVVGEVRLCADHHEVVVVPLGPQLLGGPQPG